MEKNLLNANDLADILNELGSLPDVTDSASTELSQEELASQRRYEEIIKKHKT